MSELIHEFTDPVADPEERPHTARVWGQADRSGQWQGWLEFLPQDGGAALQTSRETTQSTMDHLVYWAGGLSRTYLEMALRRAEGRDSREPDPPAPLPEPEPAPEGGAPTEGSPGNGVHVLEVETLDTGLPARLMGTAPLTAGMRKRVPGAGVIVYDGEEAEAGKAGVFRFRVQYGSRNSGAVNMGNRIWTALRDQAASLRIDGRAVPVESHAVIEALRGS